MIEHGDDRRIVGGLYLRLGDLAQWHVVVAKCWKCGHVASIPHATLKRGRSPFTKLIDATFRMRCTACGMGGAQEVVVTKLPRNY